MALEQPELVTNSAADIFAVYKKVSMHERLVGVFGTSVGAETLETTSPVGFNSATEYYGAWVAPDPASIEVDTGGATGGTWVMTVDGLTTGTFAYNATAAVVAQRLLGLGYDATVALATGVYTITFDAAPQVSVVPVLTGSVASLTGGSGEAVTVDAGASTFGLSSIVGFVWPDEVTLSATEQVNGVIFIAGRISYTDIVATVAVGDVDALAAELKANALSRGIIVEDLVNIH
jgi:hypothetical protein